MNVRAFAGLKDFSEPEVDPLEIEEEEPEEDDRLDPEQVAVLVNDARRAALAEGRALGFTEGQEAERQALTGEISENVTRLMAEVAELRGREDELFDDLQTRSARLLLALVHQLAARMSEEEARRLVEDVTLRAIEAVRGKHRITIRASEEFMEPLRAVLRMPTDAEAGAHRILFEVAENVNAAPLEVAWLTGKVTFDPYAFTEAIDEVFTETLDHLMGDQGSALREGEPQ